MKIAYVVSCYFGERRIGVVNSCSLIDKLYFVKKQVEVLNTLDVPHIEKIILTVNINNSEDIKRLSSYLESVTSKIPIEAIFNENKGFSYKAWENAIQHSINEDFDYYFFIEDDYIPVENYFYLYFLDQMTEYTGYVCELVFTNHASGPNGIIKKKTLVDIHEKYGRYFDLNDDAKSYIEGENNQWNFLNFVIKEGKILKDITPNVKVHRMDHYGKVAMFGHLNRDPIIQPIYCTRGFVI